MTSRRERREAVVREHMESENRHDFDATIATFRHPRYELVATGQVYDGEEAVRAYFAASRTAFPDQRNELIALHHTDAGIVTEFDLLGTHLGPLMGFEPTGREFRCRMVAFFLFSGSASGDEGEGEDGEDDDGLVCERVYFDSGTILSQLGLAGGSGGA